MASPPSGGFKILHEVNSHHGVALLLTSSPTGYHTIVRESGGLLLGVSGTIDPTG
ncbi:MAG: hypothetical protein QW182_05305 [Thermosphaera sp.]